MTHRPSAQGDGDPGLDMDVEVVCPLCNGQDTEWMPCLVCHDAGHVTARRWVPIEPTETAAANQITS